MSEQITIQNIIENVYKTVFARMRLDREGVPDMMISPFFYNIINERCVSIIQEAGEERIEIDVDKMRTGQFYTVKYDDEVYAVKKIGDEKIAFYDVIE